MGDSSAEQLQTKMKVDEHHVQVDVWKPITFLCLVV